MSLVLLCAKAKKRCTGPCKRNILCILARRKPVQITIHLFWMVTPRCDSIGIDYHILHNGKPITLYLPFKRKNIITAWNRQYIEIKTKSYLHTESEIWVLNIQVLEMKLAVLGLMAYKSIGKSLSMQNTLNLWLHTHAYYKQNTNMTLIIGVWSLTCNVYCF